MKDIFLSPGGPAVATCNGGPYFAWSWTPGPSADLPEAGKPALLVGVALLLGAGWLARRRRMRLDG
jgi:LPXTG-motif cell wall-anchored protein